MSTGRSAQELHDWLVKNGHECVSFYGNHRSNYSENEAHFMGNSLEHKIHAISGRLYAEVGIGSWKSTNNLLVFINEYKPDIVHIRNLHGNYVHIPRLLEFLAKKNIATIVQLDDCYYFTGGCMHYTSNKCHKWQNDCHNCKYLKRGKQFIFYNRAKFNLKRKTRLFSNIPRLGVIGVSKWIANEARLSTVLKETTIIDYIYNWIDLDVFKPKGAVIHNEIRKELNVLPTQKMIIGVASGWGRQKGLEDFFALRKKLSDDYIIVLVGKMPANTILPEGIINIKATSSASRLADLYSAADIFVHLSREETFGKVTAEALACGTPAIVYNSTANPELVDDKTGKVIIPGEINEVVSAINQIDKEKLLDNCTQRAKSLFDLETNCKQLLNLYNRTIALTNN